MFAAAGSHIRHPPSTVLWHEESSCTEDFVDRERRLVTVNQATQVQVLRLGAEIPGEPIRVRRPRHSAEEMHRLFQHINNPGVDSRFSLAFALGGEQRIGQVLRCSRTQLVLPSDSARESDSEPAGTSGVLYVKGEGKKMASPIALLPDEYDRVQRELTIGYLANYEQAFKDGQITDYPLFPSGRFVKGRAKVFEEPKPLTRDAARGMFRVLEEVAGVESLPGRGWYGVRRRATDVAEDVESDERVLNAVSAHRDSTTRRLVYQDRMRPELLDRTAQLRSKIRVSPGQAGSTSNSQNVPQRVPQMENVEGVGPRRLLQLQPIQLDRLERAMGLEPTTSSLGSWHSTN